MRLYLPGRVKPEKTAWRDEKISARHRQWGFDCPAVDIDFAVIEYSNGDAFAIVDYKREGAKVTIAHPTNKALSGLYRKTCDDPPTFELIPAWLARYWPETWAFRVACLNPPAFKLFRTERQVVELTESEYVSRLWEARGFDPAIQTLKI